MPGGFPTGPDLCNGLSYATVLSGATKGSTLTTGAANTVGAWTQLVAATTDDINWLTVNTIAGYNASAFAVAVDIGIGAAASEQVIANQLMNCQSNSVNGCQTYGFPVSIPAGTRIAARGQASGASDTPNIYIQGWTAGFTNVEGAAGVDSIGFVTASTKGTTIDPGGTANTKGSYAQLTASTTRDYIGIFFGVDINNTTAPININWVMDIAIGAAASEKIIIPDVVLAKLPTSLIMLPGPSQFYPIAIPAGTRLSASSQCTVNTANTRLFGLTLYGVYQ